MLVLKNTVYRPDPTIPYSWQFAKETTDSNYQAVKDSYLRYESATQDLTNGYQFIYLPITDPHYWTFYEVFGDYVTEESILHVAFLQRARTAEFAGEYSQFNAEWRQRHGMTLTRTIEQIQL